MGSSYSRRVGEFELRYNLYHTENVSSPWILFEAGALSKSMLDSKVIPLLFGLEQSDLSGPLSQFQAQKFEETGLMEIVKAINKALFAVRMGFIRWRRPGSVLARRKRLAFLALAASRDNFGDILSPRR